MVETEAQEFYQVQETGFHEIYTMVPVVAVQVAIIRPRLLQLEAVEWEVQVGYIWCRAQQVPWQTRGLVVEVLQTALVEGLVLMARS